MSFFCDILNWNGCDQMEINKIKVFLDLSKTLNYSETANRLFTTQGNISKQILSLEKELGVKLFVRAHRKISLSDAGVLVKPYARKIVNDYESLNIKIGDYLDDQSMSIKLRTIPTMTNYDSFLLMSRFLKEHSEVHVDLQEEESDQLFDSLRRNDCDIIFARTFDYSEKDLERIPMESDELVAVIPADDELANDQVIKLEDLAAREFLLLGETTMLLDPIIDLCHQVGFDPKISYTGVRVDLIIGMIKRHLGISLMMKKTAEAFSNSEIAILPLDHSLKNELSFIRKQGHNSKASNKFWEFIKTNKKQ